jgi:hypothetical protein
MHATTDGRIETKDRVAQDDLTKSVGQRLTRKSRDEGSKWAGWKKRLKIR